MKKKLFITQSTVTKEEIKRIRKKLKLTQKEFAQLVNCSKVTVERWETSDEPVSGPIVILLDILNKYPEYVEEIKIPERTKPLRLWYMHNQKVCTIIDVDDSHREIEIKNYVSHPMFRAFGIIDKPTYDMYLEFLESRCFPRTRDKLKLVLKDLDLPFYDPFMIVEKTEGRMAEDNFWIKIEK